MSACTVTLYRLFLNNAPHKVTWRFRGAVWWQSTCKYRTWVRFPGPQRRSFIPTLHPRRPQALLRQTAEQRMRGMLTLLRSEFNTKYGKCHETAITWLTGIRPKYYPTNKKCLYTSVLQSKDKAFLKFYFISDGKKSILSIFKYQKLKLKEYLFHEAVFLFQHLP